MDIAEGLLQLDPVRTYARRGAEHVAKAVRAVSYVVERDGADVLRGEGISEGEEATVTLPLRSGREVIGSLGLYLPQDRRLAEDELRVARWAARLYARGLSYTERLATEGGRRTDEEVGDALARTPLTPREREVVGLLLSGASTRDIAEGTGLTVSTINTYMKRIFAKLGVHSRVELVARIAGTTTHAVHATHHG
jgi:DNA-binding CsgD family transcriptional regulator